MPPDAYRTDNNTFFTTGTGSNQPYGVITRASVGKVGLTGQTLTIIYDDLRGPDDLGRRGLSRTALCMDVLSRDVEGAAQGQGLCRAAKR